MANVTGTITLDDFRAGIHGDFHAGTANTADGSNRTPNAATIDGTYRCCSDMSGALVPLPRRVLGRTHPLSGTFDPGTPGVYVMDAIAFSPLFSTEVSGAESPDGEAVAVALTMNRDFGNNDIRQLHLVRLYDNYFSPSVVREVFWSRSNTYTSVLPHFQLGLARNFNEGANATDHHLVWTTNPANALGLRGNAIPADELTLTTFDTGTTTGSQYPNIISNVYAWPEIDDTDVSTTQAILGLINCGHLVGHQGRVVVSNNIARDFGSSARRFRTDRLAYNRPNTLIGSSLVPGYFALIGTYGEENTSGVGFLASVTADQLLIMRNHGGGVLVQGDLENPTVSRLPYLESTYGVSVVPASTPLGLVYATRNGIFAWSGSETSTKLSAQLDGTFFDHRQLPSTERYSGNRGRMDYWHPWVCVPNNYLLDTRTGGWWRLDDPTTNNSTPYNCYSVVPSSGKMYAFPYRLRSPEQATLYDVYDPTVLATSYSWRSQPLVETRNRLRTFQTVTLVASPGKSTGTHTVNVTLTGYAKDGTQVAPRLITFAFADTSGNGRPVVLESDVKPNFTAMYVQVQIEASTSDESAACKIHNLSLGFRDAQGVAKV